jgi:SAM-dependent MidA family methyltransferase
MAHEDVLANPGEQDITAHVNFSVLQEHGQACGLATIELETLARALLKSGEAAFTRAIQSPDPAEAVRLRLQLKTLLVGMGESFRVWIARKEAPAEPLQTTRG